LVDGRTARNTTTVSQRNVCLSEETDLIFLFVAYLVLLVASGEDSPCTVLYLYGTVPLVQMLMYVRSGIN
jgi:hypothetical protein